MPGKTPARGLVGECDSVLVNGWPPGNDSRVQNLSVCERGQAQPRNNGRVCMLHKVGRVVGHICRVRGATMELPKATLAADESRVSELLHDDTRA